ncbi:MAG: glycosyltransferase [Bacteroidaceae bacterium]|nr:glycosyltransferase [Bacteroidaceae bacterium]
MLFVRDKGQMGNNILQYGHAYAWARENDRSTISLRFAYKYRYFHICKTKGHRFFVYSLIKFLAKIKAISVLSFPETMSYKAIDQALQGSRTAVVEGWGLRFYGLFLKYRDEITRLFAFLPEVERAVGKTLEKDEAVRIGVHIRRGDYKRHLGGIYYYEDETYIRFIRQALEQLSPEDKKKKIGIYICGNDPSLNKARYVSTFAPHTVHFPNGNPGEDMCLLSKMDYIIGPPSTFSLVASMYHDTPIFFIRHAEDTLTYQHFADYFIYDDGRDIDDTYGVSTTSVDLRKKKRLLFLISRFLDGGIDTVLVERLNSLNRLGDYDITFAIGTELKGREVFLSRLDPTIRTIHLIADGRLVWYKNRKNDKMRFLKGVIDEAFLNPIRRYLTRHRLQKLAERNDVLIDFDATFGTLVRRIKNIRKLVVFHFSFEAEMQRAPHRMQRIIRRMRSYDFIVTISKAMRDEALRMMPDMDGHIVQIYNALNPRTLQEKSEEVVTDERINQPYLLSVERLEERQKDLTTLIQSYAILVKKGLPNLPYLYIIGEGASRQQLESLITLLELQEKVMLIGFVENPYPWIVHAQAIVHSAKFEGLPTALIEALILDQLIVSSDCPTGPREILRDGRSGLLVPVGDPQSMADAIERILTDKELRDKLKGDLSANKNRFVDKYNTFSLEQLF